MDSKVRSIILSLACIILTCNSTNIEDSLVKCHLTDDVCQGKTYAVVLSAIQSGIMDVGVKSVASLPMSNITTSILGMVDFTLVNGIATGMKNCETVSFTSHIERQVAHVHIICKINIEGRFKVSSSSPVIQKLFGDSINGEGDGTLILDDLHLFFETRYNANKGEDGENYLICRPKELTYKHIYSGKTKFIADSLISDNQDANDFIVNFLEENSSFIKGSIGSAFLAKAVKFYYDFCEMFFKTVPAKKFVLDDLTPFLKN